MEDNKIDETKQIIKDIVKQDGNISEDNNDYEITGDELREALRIILQNKNLSESQKYFFIENTWKIHYRVRPPTIDEFLTPKWLGAVADQLYPHVKKTIKEFLNPYGGKRILALSTAIGYGKAQPLYSNIMLKNGMYKKMENIKIGDKLAHPKNKESEVIAIHPQGKKDIYRVWFDDNKYVDCTEDHLWRISDGYRRHWDKEKKKSTYCIRKEKVLPLREFKDNLKNKNGGNKYWIPITNALEFTKKKHLIHPYIIGALIGDGDLSGTKVAISCHHDDIDIIYNIRENLPEGFLIKKGAGKYNYTITEPLSVSNYRPHRIRSKLKELNLNKKTYYKHIPEEYLYDSIENRIELLQGLMDTDGWTKKNGHASFSTVSPQLKKDFEFLCDSLGLRHSTYSKIPKGKRTNGENYYRSYTIHIHSLPNFDMFKLERKQKRLNERKQKRHSNDRYKKIVNIEYVGKDKAQCITVSADDGLYITDHATITHNSTISAIVVFYIIVHIQYMRNPKEFFNLNEMGSLVIALLSFTKEKVDQILFQPFKNLLKSSPMTAKVKQEDRLQIKQDEVGPETIVYTAAGRMGSIQFSKDIHITTVSDRSALLGLNIIFGVASEISFWIKKGISTEEIWGAFADLRERVNSRFHHRFLSGVVLDSSPLDLSLSPIDKWLYTGEAQKDPEVMFVNAKHWEVFPERHPTWRKTGETFPVFRGDASRPPKILNEEDTKQYSRDEIIRVPIDNKRSFQNDTKKMVADYAAWPAGGIAKLISDFSYVEGMFTEELINIYDFITAPANRKPEELIWNQVRDKFFIKIGNRFEFYRAPRAKRTVHLDLSLSGDVAGVAMNHLEIGIDGEHYIINDFTLAISPQKSRINLDAIARFILDLQRKGNIYLHKVTADQYASPDMLQRLKRDGVNVDKLSVDRETAPYKILASWILNERVKVGYNIFLKNNLQSLIETTTQKGKPKIDHSEGEIVYDDGGDWNKSFMGFNAKDVSDAFTGSAYVLISELTKEIPQYQWIEGSKEREDGKKSAINSKIIEDINKKFGLVV